MRCEYFDAGLCRSCTRMGVPYQRQLREKAARARELLGGHPEIRWLEPAASPEEGFRNKAKMVVSGTASDPVLGILDRAGRGIDLSSCGLYPEPILRALPALREFIAERGLTPYDVPARRGELKHLLVTVSPDGELMVRFVLRSKKLLVAIRDGLPGLRRALPGLRVASVNILREHAALIEGDEEIVLTEARSLPMRLNGLELSLRPGGFFQTNTEIAARMYRQGAEWIRAEAPAELWDLYCGVGGFALHAARELGADAGAAPRVLGIEVSPEAVASAAQTAERAGMDGVEFRVGDARVLAPEAGAGPEALVVNPPRRGIGPELARWIEASGARTLVYSSCNARSLAEDLRHLPSFAAREGLVLDMFPQTDHFETMLLLRREARAAGPAAVGDAA